MKYEVIDRYNIPSLHFTK